MKLKKKETHKHQAKRIYERKKQVRDELSTLQSLDPIKGKDGERVRLLSPLTSSQFCLSWDGGHNFRLGKRKESFHFPSALF